jgi:imidazolonepropionase-like amidohydrolase
MDRAGVSILAGTDVQTPWCLPGFGLHDELALMVQAGLTPASALRTATINPAVFLGRERDLGTIAKGKIADLVLLDANPLQDIRNTTRINAVVLAGRLLDRDSLDMMLSQVEAAASIQKPVK